VSTVREKRTEQNYNKWYIKPTIRMKKVQSTHLIDKSDTTYIYKQLYTDSYTDP
jgi:hypothetical protein